jgi:hypothetical protein
MSPKRSRKPLNDVLAEQFIYGEMSPPIVQELPPEATPPESFPEQDSDTDSKSVTAQSPTSATSGVTEKTVKLSPLMNRFQAPPREPTVRFTVDLSTSMHRKLSILAARTGKKKAEIVRVLLDEALKNVGE